MLALSVGLDVLVRREGRKDSKACGNNSSKQLLSDRKSR
jgi:hypothetical protein